MRRVQVITNRNPHDGTYVEPDAELIDKVCDLIKRYKNGTVVELCVDYYAVEGNEQGGLFHIVLEDGNTADEHVEWCMAQAIERGDLRGVLLGERLLGIPEWARGRLSMKVNKLTFGGQAH